LNDQLDVMVFDQGDLTMHTVNNITKKRVSWKDDSLFDGLRLENILKIWVM
jgi:hypothetical protein